MTVRLDPATALGATPDTRVARTPEIGDASKQFESLLLSQLVKVLRESAPMMGSGPGAEMYLGMFDRVMAESLADGGGIGLAGVLQRGMQGAETLHTTHRTQPQSLLLPSGPTTVPGRGLTARLQRAAGVMLRGGGEGWSREGTLTPSELQSDFRTREAGGVARFNVRDARGYRGYHKCNLFAFELARQAGFEVPVTGRARGWGFPAPNAVTNDARDGRLQGDWARVVTGESAASLDAALHEGRRAFMLTAAGHGDGAGHMAIVERVHEVTYGAQGAVRRIVFDGWEARGDGARHLSRRTWNRFGHPGGSLARNGFDSIEILELSGVPAGRGPEVPISRHAGPSRRDLPPQDPGRTVR